MRREDDVRIDDEIGRRTVNQQRHFVRQAARQLSPHRCDPREDDSIAPFLHPYDTTGVVRIPGPVRRTGPPGRDGGWRGWARHCGKSSAHGPITPSLTRNLASAAPCICPALAAAVALATPSIELR